MTDTVAATAPSAPSQAGGLPLVDMRHIRVAFGGIHAVDDVTVDLYAGEVVGLVGGNGAGKSTLIHTLSGAHPADTGDIRINGVTVAIHNPRDARAHGIEVIYQKLARSPTTSTPLGTSSSGVRCAPAPARSTTRPWPRRPRS